MRRQAFLRPSVLKSMRRSHNALENVHETVFQALPVLQQVHLHEKMWRMQEPVSSLRLSNATDSAQLWTRDVWIRWKY